MAGPTGRIVLPVRMLFVSGTTVGGSGRSQRELAARLVGRGHEVRFVVDDHRRARATRFVYEQLADLSARLGRLHLSWMVRPLEGLPGRKAAVVQVEGLDHRVTPVPENAVARAIDDFRPDVVVGNSILRLTWRKVLAECARRNIATVLYVREVAAMNHFTLGYPPADRIVANSEGLAAEVERHGYACAFVPSVVELDSILTESTRRAALLVNPIPTHGIDLLWRVAARLPDVPFVVQQSWPLSDEQVAGLRQRAGALANVELRAKGPADSTLYRDARVLVVPHRIDNRPRIVLEAQANGIPVLASRVPGLAEAVGDGGVLLDMDDVDAWVDALGQVFSDESWYVSLCERARAHARRPEVDPVHVVGQFESVARDAIAAAAAR